MALALTLVVEVPLVSAAMVALRLAGMGRAVLIAVGVNLATHPVLWWSLAPHPTMIRLCGAEVVVCAVEAGLMWLAVRRDAPALIVLSVGANAASTAAGLMVTAVVGG